MPARGEACSWLNAAGFLCSSMLPVASAVAFPSSDAVVKWLSVRTHHAGAASSNPACVKMQPIGEEGNWNHLIKSNFLSSFFYAQN